jgi:hypothetical protein
MNKPASSLSQFIEEYPLYTKFGINQPIEAADLGNLTFNFFCKNEKEIRLFKLETLVEIDTINECNLISLFLLMVRRRMQLFNKVIRLDFLFNFFSIKVCHIKIERFVNES